MKEKLPAFMVPGILRRVEDMPLTKNGKIDRKKLAELVGGKTNYPNPDISFDLISKKSQKQDNRISRIFLDMNAKFRYSRKVLIINHKPKLDKSSDNQQALFLETYVQRTFNLLDS